MLIVGGFLTVLLILIAAMASWMVFAPWPQKNGTIEIAASTETGTKNNKIEITADTAGKSRKAEIIRDKWGVPQIYADREEDLLFAQGYVHAQDRLWQMDMNRRAISGTLSEVFGEMSVEMDKYFRAYSLKEIAKKTYPKLDEGTRKLLEAYSAGVNYYIEQNAKSLSVEFTMLGIKPEKWTPEDSLAWGNMMSLFMSYNHSQELIRAKMIASRSGEDISELFPFLGDKNPLVIPKEVDNYAWLNQEFKKVSAGIDRWMNNHSEMWGSNNWVVSGSRTTTGQPILANDTHINLGMPSLWYENGLHGGRFDSAGFTFPGVPLIVTGHNAHISWGITNLNSDVQDLYLEKFDREQDPARYLYKGDWKPITIKTEQINVKGKDPVIYKVYATHHGTIINQVLGLSDEHPLALQWTLNEGSTLFTSIVQINLAKDWNGFREALKTWDNACQNFVFADTKGNIGYQAACKVPVRESKHQGTVPVPGWTGEYEWKGYVPFDKLPTQFNPPAGYIVTTNNDVTQSNAPLSYDWAPGDRAARISDLLKKGGTLSPQDMETIQTDTYSLFAENIRPYLLGVHADSDLAQKALDEVRSWDLYTDVDSIGTSVFEVWYNFMLRNMFERSFGWQDSGRAMFTPASYLNYPDWTQPTIIKLMNNPESSWFDDPETTGIETRDDMIAKSLDQAVEWLRSQYGEDIQKWNWGRLHTITFTHTPFGQSGIALMEKIFNSKKYAIPGSTSTVNMASFYWNQPFTVGFGTSQRMIIDMSQLNDMKTVNSTGQSGHLFHKNREDQIPLWVNNQYINVYFSEDQVRSHAEDKLILEFKP